MAWAPYRFGSTADDADLILTIWYPDSSIPVREIVVDDMENTFSYLKKGNNLVRIDGGFFFPVGVGTTIHHLRKYRLTRWFINA